MKVQLDRMTSKLVALFVLFLAFYYSECVDKYNR